MARKKRRTWAELTSQERRDIMEMADSMFIPPQYVQAMYEQGQIAGPDDF